MNNLFVTVHARNEELAHIYHDNAFLICNSFDICIQNIVFVISVMENSFIKKLMFIGRL